MEGSQGPLVYSIAPTHNQMSDPPNSKLHVPNQTEYKLHLQRAVCIRVAYPILPSSHSLLLANE